MMHDSINVKGTELQECSTEPLTGWFRDGCCNTDERDGGSHTVCAIVTEEFLQFALSQGNDLITPAPQFGFPGLKPGDSWCVCVESWLEALHAKIPHRIDLGATHHSVIEYCDLETLRQHAIDG